MKQTEEHLQIWNDYLEKLKTKYQSYIPNFYKNSNYQAVILESRPRVEIETIIKNTFYFLSRSNFKWGLTLFYTDENKKFIEESNFFKNKNITLKKLDFENINLYIYDSLFTSLDFWQNLNSENILIFQIDSTLLNHGIDDFLNFEYIGAPWSKPKEGKYIGNGGLSFRKKSKMLEIISKYPTNEYIKEDIYFCKYLDNLPPLSIAKRFSVEDVYYENPLGIHQPKVEPQKLKYLLDKSLERIKL